MQTAALYIRVSTEDQTEFSPDAQKRQLYDYAKKNELIISNEYIFIDEGISGREAEKRPAFMKMIFTAKKKPKPFDIILVHKFDRFSRSREDSIVYKSLLKKECDIKVISITEQLEDDKFSVILEAMLEAMAEYYSLNLAEEVTKGMTEKALRGGYQTSPPLGYTILHSGDLPIIIPEEADIIKLIFSKYVHEGMTLFEIARYLNMLGLKTKYGKDFERRSVEYIIQNPMYTGYVRWNRTHNATNEINDISDWIIKKGKHEPIISEELFNNAQARIRREYSPRNSRPITEYKHWLSSLIKCGNCGKTMIATIKKDTKYYNFQCTGYSKGKCTSNSISENKLSPAILLTFQNVIASENVNYEVIEKDKMADTSLLEQQLDKTSVKEQRIKTAYVNGIDNLEEYKQNKELVIKEKAAITSQLHELKKNAIKDHKTDMLKRIKKVYNIITDPEIDSTEKNRAIKSIVLKIVYTKQDEKLDIYFYYK